MKKFTRIPFALVLLASVSGAALMADDKRTDIDEIVNQAKDLGTKTLNKGNELLEKVTSPSYKELAPEEKLVIYGSAAVVGGTLVATVVGVVGAGTTVKILLVLGGAAAAAYIGGEEGVKYAQKTGLVGEGAVQAVAAIFKSGARAGAGFLECFKKSIQDKKEK